MRTSVAVAIAVALVASSAHAQGPPLRIDFEGRLAKPAAPAPYTPGPPVRIDFEGRQARLAAPAPYTAGPPVRIDFEGRQPKPARVVTIPSAPSSPPPPQSLPQGQPGGMAQKQAVRAATIKAVQPEKCVGKGGSLTILGGGFGAAQGDARVVLAAASPVPLKVLNWSNDRVAVALPDDPRIAAGQTYVLGLQDGGGRLIGNTVKVVICWSKG